MSLSKNQKINILKAEVQHWKDAFEQKCGHLKDAFDAKNEVNTIYEARLKDSQQQIKILTEIIRWHINNETTNYPFDPKIK